MYFIILTLLVISEGDPAAKKEEPVQTPSANAWAAVYAKEIIDSVKRIDDYIDELPGIHFILFLLFQSFFIFFIHNHFIPFSL
ncbi:hypothetical protein M1146_05975 [Patescibacteria group bacterium]|nr:hypothetical protein [Patescibacteria group bacterium]